MKISVAETIRWIGVVLCSIGLAENQFCWNGWILLLYLIGLAVFILSMFVNEDFEI